MDRMSFIPGAQAREEIENANHLIYFRRDTAVAFADEFLLKRMHPDYQILYQTMMACMSEGDQVDITWTFQEHSEGMPEEGEGITRAVLKEASGRERVLWEASRNTLGLTEEQSRRAFNAYRDALAGDQQMPPRVPIDWSQWKGNQSISRVLSPSNILKASGTTWYFVDFSAPFASPSDIPMPWLARPTRAFDALILASILTIIYGVPPLVFGIRQPNNDQTRLGKMPEKFRRLKYSYGDGSLDDDETDVFIVG